MSSSQRRWIEKVQERLQVTSSMLGDMKAVKMLGLERVMSDLVQRLRRDEISTSKSYRKRLMAMVLLCMSSDKQVLFIYSMANANKQILR